MTSDPLAILMQAFAPLHKRAFAAAVGTVVAACTFLLTAFHLLLAPANAIDLELLSQYFPGYRVSWSGALLGAAWSGAAGFVGGWCFAFLRNLATSSWLLFMKSRAELAETRNFLDHM